MSDTLEVKSNIPADGEYVVVNAYEDMVKTAVHDLMAKTDMCRCEKCFLDVCALVYNKRYSHFVTTRKGALLANISEIGHAGRAELMVTVMEAINLVKDSPQH